MGYCAIRIRPRSFVAIICLFMGLMLITGYSQFFPDYVSYGKYIERGTGSIRFASDPLSALILDVIDALSLGYIEYMLINWLFFYAAVAYLCSLIKSEARAVLAYAYFLFSPVSLILYHTPRFLLSASFFVVCAVLLLESAKRYKTAAAYFASLLSHGFMALTSLPYIALLALHRNKYKLYVIIPGLLIFAFIFLLFDVRQLSVYTAYDAHDKGVGRYLISAVTVLFSLYMYERKSPFAFVSILGFFLFTCLFILTAYSHRLSVYVCFSSLIPVFLLCNTRNLPLFLFVIANIAFSILLVFNGYYGYS